MKIKVGDVFTRLEVIAPAPKVKGQPTRWVVRCMCAARTVKTVRDANLKAGTTRSCGCLSVDHEQRRKFAPIRIGDTFGRLTVIAPAPRQNKKRYWTVQCSCSQETVKDVYALSLKAGVTRSCGCLAGQMPDASPAPVVRERFAVLRAFLGELTGRMWSESDALELVRRACEA